MTDPEAQAAQRWRMIERAALDFRRSYQFSPDLVRVAFPPMSAVEAQRAREAAYSWSCHAFADKEGIAAYKAECGAIESATVNHA